MTAYNSAYHSVGAMLPLSASAQDALEAAGITVEVYQPELLSRVDAPLEAQSLAAGGTAIVVIDNPIGRDVFAASAPTSDETSVILSALNSSSLEDWRDILNEQESVILNASETVPVDDFSEPIGSDSGAVLLGVGGGVVLAIVVVAAVVMSARRGGRGRAVLPAAAAVNLKKLPAELRSKLSKLQELSKLHRQQGEKESYRSMVSIANHLQELFARIERRGSDSQRVMAVTEYGNTIDKLNSALGQDYYLDIAANRGLWDNPEGRLAEVRGVLNAVDGQLLSNIKQVNASQDLEFQVALEGLKNSIDKTSASDMINVEDN